MALADGSGGIVDQCIFLSQCDRCSPVLKNSLCKFGLSNEWGQILSCVQYLLKYYYCNLLFFSTGCWNYKAIIYMGEKFNSLKDTEHLLFQFTEATFFVLRGFSRDFPIPKRSVNHLIKWQEGFCHDLLRPRRHSLIKTTGNVCQAAWTFGYGLPNTLIVCELLRCNACHKTMVVNIGWFGLYNCKYL